MGSSKLDSKVGQMIVVALMLMLASFFAGALFGSNAPLLNVVSSFTFSSNSSLGMLQNYS